MVSGIALALAAPAAASSGESFIQFRGGMDAPRGFVEMCQNDGQICADLAGPTPASGSRAVPDAAPAIGLMLASAPMMLGTPLASNGSGPTATALFGTAHPLRFDAPAAWPILFDTAASMLQPDSLGPQGAIRDVLALSAPSMAVDAIAAPSTDGTDLTNRQLAQFVSPKLTPRQPAQPVIETAALADAALPAPGATTVAFASAAQPAMDDDKALMGMLKRVNRFVNGRVHQQSDEKTYGQAELWRRSGVGAGAAGDCEDLAIEKRMELIARHFPADRMFFAVVYQERVGLHAVLVVRMNDGDFVLDSRNPYIERWSDTGYSWVSVEAPGNPWSWYSV